MGGIIKDFEITQISSRFTSTRLIHLLMPFDPLPLHFDTLEIAFSAFLLPKHVNSITRIVSALVSSNVS